jgi:hypothetical protein
MKSIVAVLILLALIAGPTYTRPAMAQPELYFFEMNRNIPHEDRLRFLLHLEDTLSRFSATVNRLKASAESPHNNTFQELDQQISTLAYQTETAKSIHADQWPAARDELIRRLRLLSDSLQKAQTAGLQ